MRARQIIENAKSQSQAAEAQKTLLARIDPVITKAGYKVYYHLPTRREPYPSIIWIGHEPQKRANYNLQIRPVYDGGCYTPENPNEVPVAWRGMIADTERAFQGDDVVAWVRADLDELVELMATRFIDMIQRRYARGLNDPDMGEVVRHGFEDTDAYLELALSETKLMVGRVNAAFPRRKKLMVNYKRGTDLRPGQLFPGRVEVTEASHAEHYAEFGYLGFDYILAEVFPRRGWPHHTGKAISNSQPPIDQIYEAVSFIELGLMGKPPEPGPEQRFPG